MPIHIEADVSRLDQNTFSQISHELMGCVFSIHNELGRFFDEKIYKRELQRRFPGVQLEVPINVTFESFSKKYFLDVLVENGAIFEFKAVETLAGKHRSQLLHYLLLAELAHGKLINMRTEQVQHEFVNTSLCLSDRTSFVVAQQNWQELSDKPLRPWCEAFLREVGTNLDLGLYEEALTYWLGEEQQVTQEIEVISNGVVLGSQKFRLTAPDVALKITAFEATAPFEIHAKRVLLHTTLKAIQWINITRKNVTFRMIHE